MQALPDSLEKIFINCSEPDAVLSALLPALCEELQCDRCFLYLRNPKNNIGKTAYCWCRNPNVPNVGHDDLRKESESLPQEDPLFAAALQTKPSVYVEDVETASPDVVNVEFERQSFGHRALIHAHLCRDGVVWGILQPCVFGQPRVWTERDRAIISELEQRITPLAMTYVRQNIPD
jgi:GAF domain-containing protein